MKHVLTIGAFVLAIGAMVFWVCWDSHEACVKRGGAYVCGGHCVKELP